YEYQLETGYSDFFDVDLGWTVSGSPTSDDWERGVPVGTTYDSQECNPGNDSQDCGEMAYVTGNGGGQAGDDDVDAGATILTSPVFDLSGYNNPYLSYERWFFNDGGSGSPNDSLRVQITNGTQTVNLDISIAADPLSGQWAAKAFKLLDYIALTPFMQLKVRTTDVSPGHL